MKKRTPLAIKLRKFIKSSRINILKLNGKQFSADGIKTVQYSPLLVFAAKKLSK